MARWKLTASHYLNLNPSLQWQQVEQDLATGQQARKSFNVPQLLDVNNPRDYNDPEGIVVSNGTNAAPRDYVFLGDPTPDMEPMDEEAQEISASVILRGQHPIDSLPAHGIAPQNAPKTIRGG
jgi:hypothetical protein